MGEKSVVDHLCSNSRAFALASRIVKSLFFFNLRFQAQSSSVAAQAGCCWTWSETLKIGFPVLGLILAWRKPMARKSWNWNHLTFHKERFVE